MKDFRNVYFHFMLSNMLYLLQDTIVALQALIEYSFETHVRDITSMKVTVESSSNAGIIQTLNISNNNLAESRRVDVSYLCHCSFKNLPLFMQFT